MTHVIHVRDMPRHPDAIYCGRAVPRWGLKASVFGNPFKDGMSGRDAAKLIKTGTPRGNIAFEWAAGLKRLERDDAIYLYAEWISQQPDLIARAKRELTGRALACWCFPQKCHCDVLVEICEQEQP